MKLMVTTGSFIAGAVIDDETKTVVSADPFISHLRGLKEDEFRAHCTKQKWAVSVVP